MLSQWPCLNPRKAPIINLFMAVLADLYFNENVLKFQKAKMPGFFLIRLDA